MSPDSAVELFLTTDYMLDKIIGEYQGSFSAGSRHAQFDPRLSQRVITHGLGDFALVTGAYSLDGTAWFPLGVSVADTSNPQPVFQVVDVSAYCDATGVVIQASNWTASSATVRYTIKLIARS